MAMICNHVNDVQTFEKDNKIIRAAMLKIQSDDVIFKSQQQILGEAFDEKEMKKQVELWKTQLQEEKVKSHQEGNRDRDREATRIAIASIKRTVEFDDAIQAERDFLAIIGTKNPW
ncbi:hypothetical protein KY290_028269 [Solanum tuberosum]|uniref:Uncharacterized protein n=1 Tax=Solanum tuberosum TaxID=4113 RepID=A0ABQ7UHF2_SOLTU|nr:hypothetical protein KY290_028269 [Solanum tuberosum]